MPEGSVLYEAKSGVATLTLNRPAVLNALDHDMVARFADRVEAAEKDPDVWVVVVRGAGRAFCSGMDRKALSTGQIGDAFYRHWIRALNCLEDMDKLVVGVLQGYSIGGGLQLAVACDLRLARIIGMGRAKELTLLNDHITPEAALGMGLVTWVVPAAQLDAKLAEIVEKAFHASRTATGQAKRLLQASFHTDPRDMIEEMIRAQAACRSSWEIEAANRAWDTAKKDVRFYPPPSR